MELHITDQTENITLTITEENSSVVINVSEEIQQPLVLNINELIGGNADELRAEIGNTNTDFNLIYQLSKL